MPITLVETGGPKTFTEAEIADLLANEPVRLRASRWQAELAIGPAVGLGCLSIWLGFAKAGLLPALALFVGGLAVALAPSAAFRLTLTIGRVGISVGRLRRRRFVRWSDIENFRIETYSGDDYVACDFRQHSDRPHWASAPPGEPKSWFIWGASPYVPALVDLMRSAKARWSV